MEPRLFDEFPQDLMLPEQFEVAVNATSIRDPKLIAASKAIFVDGTTAIKIAKKHHINVSKLYLAAASIKAKWGEICSKEGWKYASFAIPDELVPIAIEYQRSLLKAYIEKKANHKRRAKT
jgi:hypothetical protein